MGNGWADGSGTVRHPNPCTHLLTPNNNKRSITHLLAGVEGGVHEGGVALLVAECHVGALLLVSLLCVLMVVSMVGCLVGGECGGKGHIGPLGSWVGVLVGWLRMCCLVEAWPPSAPRDDNPTDGIQHTHIHIYISNIPSRGGAGG